VIQASGARTARDGRVLVLRLLDEGWKHLSPKPCYILPTVSSLPYQQLREVGEILRRETQ
jgi:hypothetical protein